MHVLFLCAHNGNLNVTIYIINSRMATVELYGSRIAK